MTNKIHEFFKDKNIEQRYHEDLQSIMFPKSIA